MVGAELISHLKRDGKTVAGTTRRKETLSDDRYFFDLASLEGLAELPEAKVVYIVAAIARLEDCKLDPGLSRKVNVDAVQAITNRFAPTGAFVIFLSTDKVFDGTEVSVPANHPTNPQTVYGHQKAAAEEIVKKFANSAIVRLTKVFGKEVILFKNWIEKLKNKDEINPFSDMYMAPISVENVAECLSLIGTKQEPGIHQLSGNKDISYAEAAMIGAETMRFNKDLIKPIKTVASGIFHETPPRHASLAVTPGLANMPVDTEKLIQRIFSKI